jgi:Holliday junction DNA helicase RuvA
MISFVTGKIIELNKDSLIVLTASGVGYELNMPPAKVLKYKLGQEMPFFTYLKISENDMSLYGFESTADKAFFTMLLSVSGVGPKSAMNILGLGSAEEIKSAIARKDVKYLTAVQGMGKKTAERLVVELKSKVKDFDVSGESANDSQILADVIDGLGAMGYSREEVKYVIKNINTEKKTTEELLKIVLQKLSK